MNRLSEIISGHDIILDIWRHWIHWHCPPVTHLEQVTSPRRQLTYVDYFNIWSLCYRRIKRGIIMGSILRSHWQPLQLSGGILFILYSHYFYSYHFRTFKRINRIELNWFRLLEGCQWMSKWVKVGFYPNMGQKKRMGGCRSCSHLIEVLSIICRDVSARLPFEVTFNWPLHSTFIHSVSYI